MTVKMISRRNWILRCIVAGLVLYICTHISIKTGASDFIAELQQSGRNLAALENVQDSLMQNNPPPPAPLIQTNDLNEQKSAKVISDNNLSKEKSLEFVRKFNIEEQQDIRAEANDIEEVEVTASNIMRIEKTEKQMTVNTTLSNITTSDYVVTTPENTSKTLNERLKELLKCHDRPMMPRMQQRGDYWVLYNYIRADDRHECYDSITYTTHADYTFMDNLVPLVERWQGPISIAMHAPGSDFQATLNTIKYLRDCTSPLVKQHVTFHIFFSTKHVPKQVPKYQRVLVDSYNCSLPAPYLNVNISTMYKTQKKLLYPVNVGRNVARESAQTHFILPSDIELYPSLNLIPQFLQMIAENKGPLLRKNPRLFVLSIFEVAANYKVPDDKHKLKEMLTNGTAVEFHKKVCHMCHNVPKSKEWQSSNVTDGLHVFHIGKRTGSYVHWEPIFIGTHADPLYDERLSWEGKSDKMTQGYALCVLDYDFQILDNAFLCHKPGIKTYKKDAKRATLAAKTNQLIKRIIFPELKILYGTRKGCAV